MYLYWICQEPQMVRGQGIEPWPYFTWPLQFVPTFATGGGWHVTQVARKKGLKNELLRFFTLITLFSINFKCIFSNEMCLSWLVWHRSQLFEKYFFRKKRITVSWSKTDSFNFTLFIKNMQCSKFLQKIPRKGLEVSSNSVKTSLTHLS